MVKNKHIITWSFKETKRTGRSNEEHMKALMRTKLDKSFLKTEFKLIKLVNELHDAGIEVIIYSSSPTTVAHFLRTTKALHEVVPEELFAKTEEAKLRKDNLGLKYRSYAAHLKSTINIFVPR